jgi:plasmid stabilization system protein ParE
MDGTYDITWDEHAIAQLKSIFDWYAKNVSKERAKEIRIEIASSV